MEFNFDFSYRCEVKTKSAHGSRQLYVHDNRVVEIKEVSSEDAPVAVTWNEHGDAGETRWYDGHHYIEVDTDLSADDLFKEMKETQVYEQKDFNTGYFGGISSDGGYIQLNERKVEWFDEAQRDKALELVDDWASKCLIIDGKAYFRCFEPHYFVSRSGLEVSVDEISDSLGYTAGLRYEHPYMIKKSANQRRGYHSRFSSSQIEQALAKSDEELPLNGKVEINVLNPEAIKFDFDKAALMEAAENFIDSFEGNLLLNLNPETLLDIAHVSKGIWEKNMNEVDGDDLAEVILSSLNRVSEEDMDIDRGKRHHLDNVRAVINRWDDRDIGLSNSFSIGI